jgi:hypothetical protein
MKNNLFTLAAALTLAAVISGIAVPANAQVKAALVQNQDEPGRRPFVFLFPSATPFAVPVGTRLVLQHFSISGSAPSAVGLVVMLLQTPTLRLTIPVPLTGTIGAASIPITGYVDPGQLVELTPATGNFTSTGSISGYLISCTATLPCAAIAP